MSEENGDKQESERAESYYRDPKKLLTWVGLLILLILFYPVGSAAFAVYQENQSPLVIPELALATIDVSEHESTVGVEAPRYENGVVMAPVIESTPTSTPAPTPQQIGEEEIVQLEGGEWHLVSLILPDGEIVFYVVLPDMDITFTREIDEVKVEPIFRKPYLQWMLPLTLEGDFPLDLAYLPELNGSVEHAQFSELPTNGDER